MKTKHTPGPYSYERDAVNKSFRVIGANGYASIALVYTEANAAHIASTLNVAPDGPALAEQVLDEWHGKDSNFEKIEPESVKQARAIIAKITT